MRIRLSTLLALVSPVIVLVVAAYVQWFAVGRPAVPVYPVVMPQSLAGPHGFPAWIRIAHYVNFLFMILLIRSGLQILMDHPRLYWNVHCTPGTEWIRFTPVEVPRDRLYTAKDDARYLTPWIGLPGGRHTLGLSRHWHFVSVLFWVVNGAVFIALLLATDQWRRLVPTSWSIFPGAWAVWVNYATFHIPVEPNGFYFYNPLQQLGYFGVVFILAPLSIVTGPAMSPALVNRFSWYRRLPGNRQIARSLHFLALLGYVMFIIIHVTMVAITGFARNMNHITLGTDGTRVRGVYLFVVGILVIVALNVGANWVSWVYPRAVQVVGSAIVNPVLRLLIGGHAPRAEYLEEDVSPFFWSNGKMPISDEWKHLAGDGVKDYRLKVYGLVENPVELSLEELKLLGKKTQITLHHCIQGWSGIAEWGGVQMIELMKLVRPKANARAVIFYSFGEGGDGGQYYDSHTMANMLHPQTLLAWEMNHRPLDDVHGAPLRLRVENQLGYKMVKWISAIEFAENYRHTYKGTGGYQEDHDFFDTMADI
jgi:methionine sulfoxide reductase catalytic subunit